MRFLGVTIATGHGGTVKSTGRTFNAQLATELGNGRGNLIADLLGDHIDLVPTFFESVADMVAAGMTPMQVIVAATKNVAEFLRTADAGTLEADKSADFSCSMPARWTTSPTRGASRRCTCAARPWTERGHREGRAARRAQAGCDVRMHRAVLVRPNGRPNLVVRYRRMRTSSVRRAGPQMTRTSQGFSKVQKSRFLRSDPEKDSFLIVLFEHFDSLQTKPGILDELLRRFGVMMAKEHSCS